MMKKLLVALFIFAFATHSYAQFSDQQNFAGTGGGTANAQTVSLFTNITSLADIKGVPLRYIPNVTNTGPATLAVSGQAAQPVKKLLSTGKFQLDGNELFATNLAEVVWDGTDFVLTVSSAATAPVPMQANTTFYVATTGSDTNNNCVVQVSPCLTIQRAWNSLVGRYSLNGFTATIKLADGTYTNGLSASSMPSGVNLASGVGGRYNPNTIIIDGNPSTPSNVVISVSSGDAIDAAGPVGFTVQNLRLVSTGSPAHSLTASGGATVAIGNLIFGPATNYQMVAQNAGTIIVNTGYTVNGAAANHMVVALGGGIVIGSVTITLTGTPAFSSSFLQASNSGTIYIVTPTFSGSATGVRYLISNNGSVFTNGQTCSTYIPGNSAGTIITGGQCN